MANPLCNLFMGGMQMQQPQPQQPPAQQQNQQINMQDALRQLQQNPSAMLKQAGFTVPDEIAGNPQAAVMHLIQSGQVKSPVMQRIQPMLNMLMGRR